MNLEEKRMIDSNEKVEYCFFCDDKTLRNQDGNCKLCGAKDLQIGRLRTDRVAELLAEQKQEEKTRRNHIMNLMMMNEAFIGNEEEVKFCSECRQSWLMTTQCPKCASTNVRKNPYANPKYIANQTQMLKEGIMLAQKEKEETKRWSLIRSKKCDFAIQERIAGLRGIVSVVEGWPIFYIFSLESCNIVEITAIFARYCGISFEVIPLQEFPKRYSVEDKTYWNAIMSDYNLLWIHGTDEIGLRFELNIIIEELFKNNGKGVECLGGK